MDVIPALHGFLLSLDEPLRSNVQFLQLLRFIALSTRLKADILLPQPASHHPAIPPAVLPQAIQVFLSGACSLPAAVVDGLWDCLRTNIWDPNTQLSLDSGVQIATHVQFGHSVGLTCFINYHHDYSVHSGKRSYYRIAREVLQIGEHQFAEVRLIASWINLMMIAWVSATNCARFYNTAIAARNGTNVVAESQWQFSGDLTSKHVYAGFTLLALLQDCDARQDILMVPHTGEWEERFDAAVSEVNNRRRLAYPEVYHMCDLCVRWFPGYGIGGKKTSVVVIDGVTLGHPCCTYYNCKTALPKTSHRWCSEHFLTEGGKCVLDDCEEPKVAGMRTCSDPTHAEMEVLYRLRGQARFLLQKQLRETRAADHSASSPPTDVAVEGTPDDLEAASEPKAGFGRRRTHNEQILVAPCGIIIARETFFGAEGVGAVIELIKRVYRESGTMPDHIFFDNNCSLAKSVQGDAAFDDVGLTVDVFHFGCKHSKTDTFCQENCNPAAYEELLGEGNKAWYFNSSIAEQTNGWLGKFQAICREMTALRFNFFLDEMILRRNQETLAKLEAKGANPMNIYRHVR
ncbi:hypothetical protein DFP72DRAFT_798441 [Ephemerocybe angulata]|uniref:CxC6 like cysteine cluster associated with KDZ domain-containing protein n=1 Tax=Ephemerocybe angulata TaxID=980116 RepID=A0A8H6II07_9AGAR|nr:hypothetical protein DFP72DRAFT_798441 [Tulosesus angulatus]